MKKVNFLQPGGFPMQLDDLDFMQAGLYETLGQLAYSLCLNSESVMFSVPTYVSGSMNWPGGYVMLQRQVLYCSPASIAGIDEAKFWFVPEEEYLKSIQFENGQENVIHTDGKAVLVYSDTQPAGGIRLRGMYVFSDILSDQVVSPITDILAGRVDSISSQLDNKMNDLSTEWRRVEFISTKYVHYTGADGYDGLRFRKNKIGNVELRGSFTVKLTPAESPEYAFYLPSGFIPSVNQTIPAFGTYKSTWYYSEIFTNGGFRLVPFTSSAPTGDYNLEIGSTIFM